MPVHELAGKPAPESILVNVPRLIGAYYSLYPDPENPAQRVSFGTSGHRGSSLRYNFNESHILAISQAICDYRKAQGFEGPLFLGQDTHALSEPARISAMEVLAANGVELRIDDGPGYTPTPVISHAILSHNRQRDSALADGIVVTPSHNPPEDGGFKYDPPHGGAADTEVTRWIESRANELLEKENREVKRVVYEQALRAETTQRYDFTESYIAELDQVVNLEAIRSAGLRIGADPMGGAGVGYWERIAERYGLDLEVVNPKVDPTFRFMTVDKDGKIRMDCSSPYAMAGLIELKDRYDLAFGNDSDFDRHGIVTPGGLMNPNHFLAVAIWYLFRHREKWSESAAVGKTLVSSSMIDRVARHLGRRLAEVPVGFKWFVDGLLDGSYGIGAEESAGASFLRTDGTVWTTDKDGFILCLLAAELTAVCGSDPARQYETLVEIFGDPVYERIDAPATAEQKARLRSLRPDQIRAQKLAGEKINVKLTRAPENGAEIGGLKVMTDNAWFAVRPSGTEDVYKIYAESFKGPEHLQQVLQQAQDLLTEVLTP